MTTDTTNKEAGALKPCPMCNASLSEATASGYHHHPANGCIFSGFELSRDDVAAWNRHAPAEVQAEPVAWMLEVPIESKRWYTSGKQAMEHWVSKGAVATPLYAAPAASGGERS